jgi:leukotriene-A4 hydrolase
LAHGWLVAVVGLWFAAWCGTGCHRSVGQSSVDAPRAAEGALDVHSHARPDEVQVVAMGARWRVSFEERALEGAVVLALTRHRGDAPLRLDTRDLEVGAVEIASGAGGSWSGAPTDLLESRTWERTPWSFGRSDPILGHELVVALPPDPAVTLVRIHYRASPQASGLQWLEPRQTADGTHPFLYSQSQAIHARSWFPCQDSPGVRIVYAAEIETDPSLRALMAAERLDSDAETGRWRFEMARPIPSYLVALAVGRIEHRSLGPRTSVWAEPSMLDRAATELADVERMLRTTETLFGPYRWGRYEVLVLPPAFPFGGMENPMLTFATPTILAGDRSLVALIAHELAHSWSGNLVTNATWSDLWLNEGFTVYIERRIVEAVFGLQRAQMEAALGLADLEHALQGLDDEDTALQVDLRGRDPDDGLNEVPYEKGALFLRMLEEAYGRETFDGFLRAWFEEHAFRSVTTEQFEVFLERELLASDGGDGPSVDAWIRGPGIPDDAPRPSTVGFSAVDEAASAFVAGKGAGALPAEAWTAHEWLRFLRALPPDLPAERLGDLDAAFELTATGNYEVLARWLETSVRHGYRAADDRLEAFLLEVGRRKFLVPLYRSLLEHERTDDARRIYAAARPGYHPITQSTLDELLGSE